MLYALRRRLAEKRPLIWCYSKNYLLFLKEGVYAMPVNFQTAVFRSIIWVLVDSDESLLGVPEELVCHCTRVFTIFATTPNRNRKRLHKTVNETVIVMNPWARDEIHRA
jgi:hypothetical protein